MEGLPLLQDNIAHWDKKSQGFYEVWYLKLNLREEHNAGPALWLRFTTLSTRSGLKRVAETWAIFFEPGADGLKKKMALKNTSTLGALSTGPDGSVQIEDCVFGPDRTSGMVVSRGNTIEWDLKFEPNRGFTFFHVPQILQKLKLTKSTVCKPNVDIRFNGLFKVNGKSFECAYAPGCQGHIWGTAYAHSWSWAHCNLFEGSQDVSIEVLSARVKTGGLVMPQLSALCLRYRGQWYEWNSLWDAITIRSRSDLTSWRIEASKRTPNGKISVKGNIECTTKDLIGVAYEDTKGGLLYCHNTEVASMTLEISQNNMPAETYRSNKSTGFETVSKTRSEYVEFLL